MTEILNSLLEKSILIPYLVGPHGVGKTSFVKEWAKKNNKSLFIINLSAVESSDLTGIPIIDNGKTVWSRPAYFDFDVLFFDEINRVADPSIKAALLSLFVDRTINGHRFNGAIIAAGNYGDNYEINEFDPAFEDRLVKIEFTPNLNFIKNERFKNFIKDNNLLDRYSLRRLTEAEKFLNNPQILRLILDPVTTKALENYMKQDQELSLEQLMDTNLSTVDKMTLVNTILNHKTEFNEKIVKFLTDLSAELWALIMTKAIETNNEAFQEKLTKCLQEYSDLWSDDRRWILLESIRQAVTSA